MPELVKAEVEITIEEHLGEGWRVVIEFGGQTQCSPFYATREIALQEAHRAQQLVVDVIRQHGGQNIQVTKGLT